MVVVPDSFSIGYSKPFNSETFHIINPRPTLVFFVVIIFGKGVEWFYIHFII